MLIRYLKLVLVAFVALLALLYAAQNVVNLEQVYFFVSTVLTMEGHEAYPSSLGPAVTSPLLIWAAVVVILIGEFTTGILSARGAWDLWKARRASAEEFNAAKTFALLGCGMALVVWFGFFTVIGGAYFQMWQTELGANSLEGAFQILVSAGVILLFVNMKDE